jgi:hypothetical protein
MFLDNNDQCKINGFLRWLSVRGTWNNNREYNTLSVMPKKENLEKKKKKYFGSKITKNLIVHS